MRRLLFTALITALLVGAFAGVASARLDTEARERPPLAPMRAPSALPLEDAEQSGTYGFRSSTEIAQDMVGAATADAPASPAAGANASITVTATVLPVISIVVEDGEVVELLANTPARSAGDVLFVVRDGSGSGEARELDASTWADARGALSEARAGVGTIWSA